MGTERVTVTLPGELLAEIDRVERNRSRFVLEAVRRELKRRRRLALHRSLDAPHTEGANLAEAGMADWASSLPGEDPSTLVDPEGGTVVRWVPGRGWLEEPT
jgi:hypothetical protein